MKIKGWSVDHLVACPGEYDKGGVTGRSASGKNTRTRAITGIDGNIRLNKALWMVAEQFREWKP